MNYWWVNQNQTHRQEIAGGYMWSPKRKKDGSRNPFYDNMTEVHPGDIVFSFFDTKIPYLGVIKSNGYHQTKPDFGSVGQDWETEGWMVNVDYYELKNKIRPKDHIDSLRPLLPNKYSPLQKSGDGNQGVYLAYIPDGLANALLDLIGRSELSLILAVSSEHQGEVKTNQEAEEERIEGLIRKNPVIAETEKDALIKARKGQGKFREEVLKIRRRCPFTGVSNPQFLKAGHLRPWSKCKDNFERLDPLNGIALTPVADQLVDQGFISFEDSGKAFFSPLLKKEDAEAMGIPTDKEYRIKILDDRQKKYFEYHRDKIFKAE